MNQEDLRSEFSKIATSIDYLNEPRVIVGCYELLSKIVRNIIENPGEEMYLRMKLKNNGTLKDKVLSVKGGLNYLLKCGFVKKVHEFEEYYMLDKVDIEKLLVANDVLQDCIITTKKREIERTNREEKEKEEEKNRRQQVLNQLEEDKKTRQTKYARKT